MWRRDTVTFVYIFVEVLRLSSSWSGLFATQTSQVGYLIHSCTRKEDFIFFSVSLALTWTQHCSQEFENDSKITTSGAGIRSILRTYYICKLMMQETFFFSVYWILIYLGWCIYSYEKESGSLCFFKVSPYIAGFSMFTERINLRLQNSVNGLTRGQYFIKHFDSHIFHYPDSQFKTSPKFIIINCNWKTEREWKYLK